jgi:hypothetical protein
MRRYIITCELSKTKRSVQIADSIRKLASDWQHPLNNVWVVSTPLNAADIRTALLPHLSFQDRLFISETGSDAAEFNAVSAGGGKVTQLGELRSKNRMLASIFSRDGRGSRHLTPAAPAGFTGASVRSLQSA